MDMKFVQHGPGHGYRWKIKVARRHARGGKAAIETVTGLVRRSHHCPLSGKLRWEAFRFTAPTKKAFGNNRAEAVGRVEMPNGLTIAKTHVS